MQTHNWQRVSPIGDESKGPENTLALRVFGQDGNDYPRLVLTIHEFDKAIFISCVTKDSPSSIWYASQGIPQELLPHMMEMFVGIYNEVEHD